MSRAAANVHRQARHQLGSDRPHAARPPPSSFNQSSLLLPDHRAPAATPTTKPVRRTSLPPSLDTVRELAPADRRLEPPAELEPAPIPVCPRRFSLRTLFRGRNKHPKRPDEDKTPTRLHQVPENDVEPRSMEWLVYRFQSGAAGSSASLQSGTTAHTGDPTFAPTEGVFTPYQYQKYSLAWRQSQHRKRTGSVSSRVQPNAGGSVSLTDLVTPPVGLGRSSSSRSLPLNQSARGRPSSLRSVQQSCSRRESAVTFDTGSNRPASIRSVRFADGGSLDGQPRAPSLRATSLMMDLDPPPTPRSILRFSGLSSTTTLPEVMVEDIAAPTSEASMPSLDLDSTPPSETRSSLDATRRPSMARSIESTLPLPESSVTPRPPRSSSHGAATTALPRLVIPVSTKNAPLASSASLPLENASVFSSSPTSSVSSLLPAHQKLARKLSPGSSASIASTDRHISPPSSWNIRNASTTTLLSPIKSLTLPTIPTPSSWGPVKRVRRGSSTSVESKKSLGAKMASIEKGVHSSKFIRPTTKKTDPKSWGPRPVRGQYDFARGPGEAKRFEQDEQDAGTRAEVKPPSRPTSARSLYVYDWTRDVSESVPWQRDNASCYSLPVFSSPWSSDEPSPTNTVVDLGLNKDKELPPLPSSTDDGSQTERSASPAPSECSLHRNLRLPKPALPEVPEYTTKHERRLAKMAERADRRLSAQAAVHSREREPRSGARGKPSTRRSLSAPPVSDFASDAATVHSDGPEFRARHRPHSNLPSLPKPRETSPPTSWGTATSNGVF
ncbi:hypothetical protein Q8F55_006634 [Vanrija albida]|uniref:Proteophosphoglycan ppg4 n=1 Tax=Vanrija albida TaxID=181172 RepID=A0ABR3PXP7_9TREE